MHRIVWALAANEDKKLLSTFIETLNRATDIDEFIKWVNKTPGIRGDQAPLTAWVDDASEAVAHRERCPGRELASELAGDQSQIAHRGRERHR